MLERGNRGVALCCQRCINVILVNLTEHQQPVAWLYIIYKKKPMEKPFTVKGDPLLLLIPTEVFKDFMYLKWIFF